MTRDVHQSPVNVLLAQPYLAGFWFVFRGNIKSVPGDLIKLGLCPVYLFDKIPLSVLLTNLCV